MHISNDIRYIGVNDHQIDLFEGQYIVPNGMAYNSYLIDDEKIADIVNKVFDLRPSAIIDRLDLRKPIYKNVAAYGHMGREDLGVSWEKTDMVDEIKKYM